MSMVCGDIVQYPVRSAKPRRPSRRHKRGAAVPELILVRHGETVGQSSVRYFGRTDLELSELGLTQMRLVRDALRGRPFRTVIASPLQRSRVAAQLIAEPLGIEPTIIPAFSEIDFGDWEGLTADEIRQRDPALFNQWRSYQGDFRFPGGESRSEFQRRVALATACFADAPQPILAVLHKGVMRIILVALLGRASDELRPRPIELGSIHRLSEKGGNWTLQDHGEVAHLGDARLPDS